MEYHFRNLVFEGGGVKGIAYVGALQILESKGILQNIKRIGGTSAGAITATLIGLNYSITEIENIIRGINFNNFLDDNWGIIRDTNRLIHDFGWYKGDFFRNWIANIIKAKTGNSETTFNDLNTQKEEKGFRDLYFMGTNLSTRFAEVFSLEHTPRMCVADAVRISMSIPLFFAAKKSPRDDVYVDGGVLDNYPVKLFDREKYVKQYSHLPDYYKEHNEKLVQAEIAVSSYVYNMETLGFRLDSEAEIAVFRDHAEPVHNKIDDFFDYVLGLLETILESQASEHLHSDDWQRTIYIDTLGIKTIEFDISNNRKDALVKSGKENTEKYFSWYDNPANRAINRPEA